MIWLFCCYFSQLSPRKFLLDRLAELAPCSFTYFHSLCIVHQWEVWKDYTSGIFYHLILKIIKAIIYSMLTMSRYCAKDLINMDSLSPNTNPEKLGHYHLNIDKKKKILNMVVLVYSSCHNKIPKIGWLNQ